MLRSWKAALAALTLMVSALPMTAMALPAVGRSVIYFDANDQVIGQQLLYCNNVGYHAGIIDPGNPFRIEESVECNNGPSCPPDATSSAQCSFTGGSVMSVDYFRSATGRSIQQYCNDAQYPGGPFWHHPGCGLPAPSQVSGLSPSGSGFNP
ncbi:hypothetical protein J2T07_002578 [Luteibacter jiangsuensis]|uniref:CVNH domain-containing protein n=1 Tax=Luteibacter jiangsuensis TaxID=637577 RepID=A0ABT9T1J5_9GAMM|nr:hypothetical protein [Luteibacter jiangsuensis]MDQ0010388.1 hypothetical protein [Luteibacter jiangsuensis]